MALSLYQQAENHLAELRHLEIVSQQHIEKAIGISEPGLIKQYYASLDGVRKRRIEQEKYLETLARLVMEKRERLSNVANEKHMLKELEKIEHREYRSEQNRLEQKFIDEISTIKHYEKTRNKGC